MNKKQLQEINQTLSTSRKQIKFQNISLQKNMVEQFELSISKTFEYIKDQSNFLKSYINELREMDQNDISPVLLDALFETIRKDNQDVVVIRRAYEDAKHDLKDGDNIEELNIIVFHLTEINEIIHSLDRVEKVLFSYPPSKG
jgi:hypothetical protein